jgi:hypothetical protein
VERFSHRTGEEITVGTFDDVSKQATEIVDKVKTGVGNIVDQSGDKTDAVDNSTGGTASAVTASVDSAVSGAVDKATDVSNQVTSTAASAVNAAKDAVTKSSGSS